MGPDDRLALDDVIDEALENAPEQEPSASELLDTIIRLYGLGLLAIAAAVLGWVL